MIDQSKDGVLLNGDGQPLEDGKPPLHRFFTVHDDAEFADFDFGQFLNEVNTVEIPRLTRDDVMSEIATGQGFNMDGGSFVAPRRSRPTKKIVLSNSPTGDFTDGFGTVIRNINLSTPHFDQVLMDELSTLMFDYIEGRFSIGTISNETMTYVELSGTLVDCSLNEHGLNSWFDVLEMYTPVTFLEELGKRIKSLYAVDVSLVEGSDCGFVLRRC